MEAQRKSFIPRIRVPFFAKAAISLLLLVVVLLKVNLQSLLESLANGNPYLIALGIFIAFAAWCVNVYKWQVLLTGERVNYRELLRLGFIGQFYNLVVPGQIGGEVVKGFRLGRMGVPAGTAALSVVLDRITGLVSLLVLGVIGAIALPGTVGPHQELVLWVIGIAVALGVVMIALVARRAPDKEANSSVSLRNPVLSRTLDLAKSIPTLQGGLRSLVLALLWAALYQIAVVYINYLFCLALGIPMSFVQLLWVVAAVSLLQSLPISIAGIGVREGAYVYLLSLQGVAEPAALALSLLTFSTQISFALIGGLLQLQEVLETRRKGILPSK